MNTQILRNISQIPNNRPLLRGYANLIDAGIPESEYKDAFSLGQLKSKQRLRMCMYYDSRITANEILICGGWVGTSAALLLDAFDDAKVYSVDLNKTSSDIADILNKEEVTNNWRFKAVTGDIFDIDMTDVLLEPWSNVNNRPAHLKPNIDTIVNTSCEHMPADKFRTWYDSIPKGTLLMFQSNNYFNLLDHINCVSSIDDFKTQAPMEEYYVEEEFDCGKYTRYFLVGRK